MLKEFGKSHEMYARSTFSGNILLSVTFLLKTETLNSKTYWYLLLLFLYTRYTWWLVRSQTQALPLTHQVIQALNKECIVLLVRIFLKWGSSGDKIAIFTAREEKNYWVFMREWFFFYFALVLIPVLLFHNLIGWWYVQCLQLCRALFQHYIVWML
jgi:hypothetical protein